MHRTANDGTDTISADQHVAVCDSTPGHLQRHTRAGRGESGDVILERDGVHADGFEQSAVKRRPQCDDHGTAQHLRRQLRALQDSAIGPANLRTSRLEATCLYDVGNAQRTQGRDRVRGKSESEAELTWRGRPLEDADRPSSLSQRQAGREATDSGAHDQSGTSQRTKAALWFRDGVP